MFLGGLCQRFNIRLGSTWVINPRLKKDSKPLRTRKEPQKTIGWSNHLLPSLPPKLWKTTWKNLPFWMVKLQPSPPLTKKNTHPNISPNPPPSGLKKTQRPNPPTFNPKKQCHFERPHGLPWSSSHDHTLGPPRAESRGSGDISRGVDMCSWIPPPQSLEAWEEKWNNNPHFWT